MDELEKLLWITLYMLFVLIYSIVRKDSVYNRKLIEWKSYKTKSIKEFYLKVEPYIIITLQSTVLFIVIFLKPYLIKR